MEGVVDAVVARYRRRVTPEPEELERLAAGDAEPPAAARPLADRTPGHPPSAVVTQLPELQRRSVLIADRARRALTH
jgi:hypothetical protein